MIALRDYGVPGWVTGTLMVMVPEWRKVTDMSCEHCARAIKAEIGKLPGVTAIGADPATGKVVITAHPFPGDSELRAAVQEAGYQMAD